MEVGVEVLDVSNANTVLPLILGDKHHCSVEFNFDRLKKKIKLIPCDTKRKWFEDVTGQDGKGALHVQHQLKSACVVGVQHLQKFGPSASFPLIRGAGALPATKRLG